MRLSGFAKMSVVTALLGLGVVGSAVAESTAVHRGAPATAATSLPDATFTRAETEGATILRVDGVITKDLEARFAEVFDTLPRGRAVVVELSSPGGYTSAGYRMIDRMLNERAAGRPVATRVRGGEACESMCVGVYLAGYPRQAAPSAEFMVHAPRMAENGRMTLRTTDTMVKRLVDLGASRGWIERVRAASGFSGSTDYRASAAHLTAEGANVVTELLR